jgi:hypothetical protein
MHCHINGITLKYFEKFDFYFENHQGSDFEFLVDKLIPNNKLIVNFL